MKSDKQPEDVFSFSYTWHYNLEIFHSCTNLNMTASLHIKDSSPLPQVLIPGYHSMFMSQYEGCLKHSRTERLQSRQRRKHFSSSTYGSFAS